MIGLDTATSIGQSPLFMQIADWFAACGNIDRQNVLARLEGSFFQDHNIFICIVLAKNRLETSYRTETKAQRSCFLPPRNFWTSIHHSSFAQPWGATNWSIGIYLQIFGAAAVFWSRDLVKQPPQDVSTASTCSVCELLLRRRHIDLWLKWNNN